MGERPGFDLVSRPWIPVLRSDGSTAELSLEAVFAEAAEVRRLVGDVPTQEFALLRLLLAIVHDAVDGPESLAAWEELWAADAPFAAVPHYLNRHRDRFDLLHPVRPFLQVAGLRTAANDVASLNRIVADVPNGEPFFTMRMPGVERLGFAEAARWLLHAHAFDTSGIKSGAVGDARVKSGKGYPLGPAWAGHIGGVFAEGRDLRETLLLNLVASDTPGLRVDDDDRPAWRRAPTGPGATGLAELAGRPSGPRDLYTWQSRRVRLHHDAAGVWGVVLGYGDPLSPSDDMHRREPMAGWRRSQTQEKKLGRPLVYMPRDHDPARAAWRGLARLLQVPEADTGTPGEPAAYVRAAVLDWVARLVTEDLLPRDMLIRTRTVGAVYGTQQSVIDEIVDDSVAMAAVLLHERDSRHGQAAVDAVGDADAAVRALGALAADLADAAGSAMEPRRDSALDLGYGVVDGPLRQWLRELGTVPDPSEARRQWLREAHRLVTGVARDLMDSAGAAAAVGRLTDTPTGVRWIDDTLADIRFRNRLNKALHRPSAATAEQATAGDTDSSKALV
jgi:CRISPR system Cascade subunit CasA